jgi:hypothetical protein
MKIFQQHFLHDKWKQESVTGGFDAGKCQLVLIFGASACISNPAFFKKIKAGYPNAEILLSSTSGEIMDDSVYDDSAVITAIQFEKTIVRSAKTNINNHSNSYDTGKHLMEQLQADGLANVFVISDGTHINGSELVAGFNENNIHNIPVTGGLAGDAARFSKTFVGLNEVPSGGNVVAIGFYGSNLLIGHGSFGGWDEFGRERSITRSNKNVLYEIDGRSALDLYKEYLGPYVDELPGSALLFPLSMRENDSCENVVRTILSINEKEKSMTFAGNLPEGSKVRLMKANFDNIIEGSSTAAQYSFESLSKQKPELAILISCVGRKLILQERVDEEVQAAKDIFGGFTTITGFYSYGEISPFNPASTKCELHNQTMTITTFSES